MAVDSSKVTPEQLSIIIPLREGDKADSLLTQLEGCGAQVILSSEGSRAKSLNIGAAKAQHKFLWFLHADTVLPENAFEALQQSLHKNETALHYFRLAFANDGPRRIDLNAKGANLRARLFGTPFGDQGLSIRKDLFFSTGGYPEDAQYGEDHLFVWLARRHGIALNEVPATLITSARRYREHGWVRTTLLYQWLWITQALPQFWLLLMRK